MLMSFDRSLDVPGLGGVDDSDIVRFTPTSTGSSTAGSFSWYFDGSDVGLTSNGEDVDAISFDANGDLIISTSGGFSVSGASGNDEDMIRFVGSQFGSSTSGTWFFHFDGSDVDLSDSSSEDVSGIWVDTVSGDLYLTAQGDFSVSGISGDGTDVFVCTPGSLGSSTTCSYDNSLFLDGSAEGLSGEVIDVLSVER
jgi:hypothetical protein